MPINFLDSGLTVLWVHDLKQKAEKVHASIYRHDPDQVIDIVEAEKLWNQCDHNAAAKWILPPSEFVDTLSEVGDISFPEN